MNEYIVSINGYLYSLACYNEGELESEVYFTTLQEVSNYIEEFFPGVSIKWSIGTTHIPSQAGSPDAQPSIN